MSLSQFDERAISTSFGTLANGTGIGGFNIAGASGYGARFDQFILTWLGAAAKEVDIQLSDGFSDLTILGTITLPASVGTVRSQVDVIGALLPAGQPFIMLAQPGQIVLINKAAITGSDELCYAVIGGNF